jgi:hypothetical protein
MEDVVQRAALSRVPIARILLLAATVALAGCFPWDHPSVERSQLEAEAAAKIRMAGAEELAHFARERGSSVEGPAFAHDSYVFGTMASEQEVIAFYDERLRALGWTRDDLAVYPGSTDLKARGWCKPRMAYRLAIVDQPRAFSPEFYRGKSFVTVYDAGLLAREVDAKCGGR